METHMAHSSHRPVLGLDCESRSRNCEEQPECRGTGFQSSGLGLGLSPSPVSSIPELGGKFMEKRLSGCCLKSSSDESRGKDDSPGEPVATATTGAVWSQQPARRWPHKAQERGRRGGPGGA